MKALILSALIALSATSAHAEENESSMAVGIIIGGTTYVAGGAITFVAGAITVGPIFTTLELSGQGFKIVRNAQEDATAFVATDGEVRTAALEQALAEIRSHLNEGVSATDMALAEAIMGL